MKISSKSILSPGRAARDHTPISLSTSLSRRLLRPNGSIKGGQASPMFPTAGSRKRAGAFENPEPSSPKVTCIGQVRVKTKKKGKQTRSHSRRRSGEVSFRRIEQPVQPREGLSQNEDQLCSSKRFQQTNTKTPYQQQQQPQECLPHRNQRWVHLPITICEALRAFGAEFSCLFPCRSSCFSTNERDKEKKVVAGSSEGNGHSSCGAVLARWLVELQDGEGGKSREIELVVDGADEDKTELSAGRTLRSSRKHVFEDLQIIDGRCEVKDEVLDGEEARVSICIPPKNALLLMRCRSDPTRVAALANRYWEKPGTKYEDCDEDNEEDAEEQEYVKHWEPAKLATVEDEVLQVNNELVSVHVVEENENSESETALTIESPDDKEEMSQNGEMLQDAEHERREEIETETENTGVAEEESEVEGSSFDTHVDQDNVEYEQEKSIEDDHRTERKASNVSASVQSDEEEADKSKTEEEITLDVESALREDDYGEEAEKSTAEKETQEIPLEEEQQTVTQPEEQIEKEEQQHSDEREADKKECQAEEAAAVREESSKSSSTTALPDCLLLMMCEPKLSMEVSKETWVCSRDFTRWLPERVPVNLKTGPDDIKKRVSTDADSNPNLAHHAQVINHQPPRSSCSFPAASMAGISMATMIEQKLVNAVGYEPFVLTRCKSEPMRTAATLAPEACFWKNRKLEPHRGATLGVGAAGVGF